MNISKIVDRWYQANCKVNGAIAVGFGTTMSRAIADCIKDRGIILELQK